MLTEASGPMAAQRGVWRSIMMGHWGWGTCGKRWHCLLKFLMYKDIVMDFSLWFLEPPYFCQINFLKTSMLQKAVSGEKLTLPLQSLKLISRKWGALRIAPLSLEVSFHPQNWRLIPKHRGVWESPRVFGKQANTCLSPRFWFRSEEGPRNSHV